VKNASEGVSGGFMRVLTGGAWLDDFWLGTARQGRQWREAANEFLTYNTFF
jgi:hypothetical protein